MNSTIPKRIAEQRISNGFLKISEYFDGNSYICILSLGSIVQLSESVVSLLPFVDDSCSFIGIATGIHSSILSSSSSLKQMTRKIER